VSVTLMILAALAPIGAIDVVYYHWYRFRLFERAPLEELTHLVRKTVFLVVVALLSTGVSAPAVDTAILVLLAVDFMNSAADVLLEPRSREALGGLPAGEYFLHYLGTFGTGVASAAYLFERRSLPLPAAPTWQSVVLIAGAAVTFAIGAALVLRARVSEGGLARVGACSGCADQGYWRRRTAPP
jgi:hypothetical protein